MMMLCAYIHFSTKHIDFEFYVRIMMYGYGVYHRFDDMSKLITKSSWIKKPNESTTQDDDSSSSTFLEYTPESINQQMREYVESNTHYSDSFKTRFMTRMSDIK